ncbi:MAG: hypothetical protein FJ219_02385 [Ignavibacteria bacterium]|nr:hypothetical protein [Ignavibacteria bacterium]
MEFNKSAIQQLIFSSILSSLLFIAISLQAQQTFYCKERLPDIVNSYTRTLLPVLHPSGSRLYFVRKGHPNNIGGINDPDDIWYSDRVNGNFWTAPINAGPTINTPNSNALFSITADGNSAFVASVSYDGNLTFHMAQLSGNSWTIGKQFTISDFTMNSAEYFATMNADQNVLILAMNHEGSLGDLDLYVSLKNNQNIWSKPLLMGNTINTISREGSPFLAQDNKTLYFYSNGFGGYGGSDLFMTKRLDDTWTRWTKPVNLGQFINTTGNERSITLTSRGDTACIISTDANNDQEGMYFVCLQPEIRPQEQKAQVALAQTPIANQNDTSMELYFRTNEWKLLPKHIEQLQDMCRGVRDKNKHVIIRGYADDRGSSDYNRALSLKRAHSVADFLIECGLKSYDILGEGVRQLDQHESLQIKRQRSRAVNIFMTIQQ